MPERGAPWPAVTYEELDWDLPAAVPTARTARLRHRGPYPAAVVPQIASLTVHLPPETAAAADEAAAEVARFDAELGQEIAPFATVLLRSEAAASSRIENLTASACAIAEAEVHSHGSHNAELVVANQRAIRAAVDLVEQIDADAILATHAALLNSTNPDDAGRWRNQQVWIGGSDLGPHGALFVPPHHQRVPFAVADLVAFVERDDVPVFIHAAIAHAQFETIHPFADGNGRTGRALVHAHLRHKGVTRNVTVPVSAGLLVNIDRYFHALTRYREGDAAPIVEAFADAAFAATTNGRSLVDDLHTIRGDWADRVKARRDSTAWRVADLLVRHPVVNAALVASETGVLLPNVYRALRPLVDAGVVVEFSDQKRNQLWRAPDVLDALDDFAARVGRRDRRST
jgi:Fic family protein